MEIHPTSIQGPWKAGWALDVHVVASDFIGYNEFGHPQFDSKRSEIGECLYQLKYGKNRQQVPLLCEAVVSFVRQRRLDIDVVVAVPPSDDTRQVQPLFEIAKGVATSLGAGFTPAAVKKIKQTAQLKNVKDPAERLKLLADAFQADSGALTGKRVLLLDDLYRSGATLSSVAQEIVKTGSPASLHVIALTRTGKRR